MGLGWRLAFWALSKGEQGLEAEGDTLKSERKGNTALQRTPMCPLLISTYTAHTHVPPADQHPTSTQPCLHCCSTPTQHTPMCPLLLSLHPANTQVSIAAQPPPSKHPCPHCCSAPTQTHPCFHCCSAPTQLTAMSPLLFSTHPAHTHVSIAA